MLQEARRRKERTYPELNGAGGRARLVVLAAEVGGRWSGPGSSRCYAAGTICVVEVLGQFVGLQCCEGFCAVVVGQKTPTWCWW